MNRNLLNYKNDNIMYLCLQKEKRAENDNNA